MNLWDDLLSERDKAVIEKAGYQESGAASWDSRALGKHPALLVIDMQEMLVGPDVPILDAIGHYRTAMGEIAWRAMENLVEFTGVCREAGIPIVYARVIPQNRTSDDPAVQIVSEIAPLPEDKVFDKSGSSVFYGTGLNAYLKEKEIDTVIVTGNSTSGCVRATTVDAKQHGYGVLVPIECVFDRIEASHKISLLDLWMKYAAVMHLADATAFVERVKKANRV